jgi:hypothetical protein
MFMPSARSHPLDSNRPAPVPKSRAQNQDGPEQRLFFLVLLKTLLGIALVHPTLSGPAKDRITDLIRGLIERLEQQRLAAPSTNPAQDAPHRGSAAILARTTGNPHRTGRTRRPRAEPAAAPRSRPPQRASVNQVHGPPRHSTQHEHPALARWPPAPAFSPSMPPHRRLAAQRVAPTRSKPHQQFRPIVFGTCIRNPRHQNSVMAVPDTAIHAIPFPPAMRLMHKRRLASAPPLRPHAALSSAPRPNSKSCTAGATYRVVIDIQTPPPGA